MRLDTSNWKEFKVKELFDVVLAKGDCQKDKLPDGDIPLITSGFTNNGIAKYVACGDGVSEIFEGNMITVDMFGYAFYRKSSFYSVSHGRVNILLPNIELTENIGKFIAQSIEISTRQSYSFSRMCSSTQLPEVIFKLPIDSNGDPDYDFMEKYINSLNVDVSSIPDYFLNEGYNKACWYMDNIDQDKFENEYAGIHTPKDIKLSDRNWEEFQIQDLFDTYTGGDLILSDVVQGDIPIVSHTSENNGVDSYSMEIENRPLFDHRKSISLGDRGTFYAARQKDDFYIGTRVKAMVFKDIIWETNNISKYAIDFIVTIINHEQFRFSYGRNCTSGLNALIIKLPVDANGNPDYQFMEDYIKTRAFSIGI